MKFLWFLFLLYFTSCRSVVGFVGHSKKSVSTENPSFTRVSESLVFGDIPTTLTFDLIHSHLDVGLKGDTNWLEKNALKSTPVLQILTVGRKFHSEDLPDNWKLEFFQWMQRDVNFKKFISINDLKSPFLGICLISDQNVDEFKKKALNYAFEENEITKNRLLQKFSPTKIFKSKPLSTSSKLFETKDSIGNVYATLFLDLKIFRELLKK